MKLNYYYTLLFYTLYNGVARSQTSKEPLVNLETYYGGDYFPYLCSQTCKKEYDEKYHKCFYTLDNTYFNVSFAEYCDVFRIRECKPFLNEIYLTENACTNGEGPDDYDVHDEINMNKAIYLSICSRDKDGNLCDYSKNIQEENYFPIHLFHMSEIVNSTLEKSCSQGICRENLRQIMELLIPLYEHDVNNDKDLKYEREYIEADKRSIEYLKDEKCTSQDLYVIEVDEPTLNNDNNESGAITTSFSLITIFLISTIFTLLHITV